MELEKLSYRELCYLNKHYRDRALMVQNEMRNREKQLPVVNGGGGNYSNTISKKNK